MSAVVCSFKHICTLVEYAAKVHLYIQDIDVVTEDNREEIAEKLLLDNIIAVQHRYDDIEKVSSLPGNVEELKLVEQKGVKVIRDMYSVDYGKLSALDIGCLLRAYEYQVCEHNDYFNTFAYKFITSLGLHLLIKYTETCNTWLI